MEIAHGLSVIIKDDQRTTGIPYGHTTGDQRECTTGIPFGHSRGIPCSHPWCIPYGQESRGMGVKMVCSARATPRSPLLTHHFSLISKGMERGRI
jgi:hypothetical protein